MKLGTWVLEKLYMASKAQGPLVSQNESILHIPRQAPISMSFPLAAMAKACCSRTCASLALHTLFLWIIFSNLSSLQLPTRSCVSERAARAAVAACFVSEDCGVWSLSSDVRLR